MGCTQLGCVLQVPQVNISLTVRPCLLGEVQQSPTSCIRCPAPQYSYSTSNATCDSPCPRNANCTGGAVVVPLEGFWVSASNSDSMVACPVGQACQGDRTAMQACLSAADATLDSSEAQVKPERSSSPPLLVYASLLYVYLHFRFCAVMATQVWQHHQPYALQTAWSSA